MLLTHARADPNPNPNHEPDPKPRPEPEPEPEHARAQARLVELLARLGEQAEKLGDDVYSQDGVEVFTHPHHPYVMLTLTQP